MREEAADFVAPLLMDRLLNESLIGGDDLPVLQHALMRTWSAWRQAGGAGAIDLEHYETSGTLNRNFLVLSTPNAAGETLVDISHESLIRQWKSLADWVDEEAESIRIYRRLAESAELHAAGKAGLCKETDLQVALAWRRQQRPTAAWAERCRADFGQVMDFLAQSVRKQKTNRNFVASLLVCLYACLCSWMVIAATDDLSLATNILTLPVIGTQSAASLIYTAAPLVRWAKKISANSTAPKGASPAPSWCRRSSPACRPETAGFAVRGENWDPFVPAIARDAPAPPAPQGP